MGLVERSIQVAPYGPYGNGDLGPREGQDEEVAVTPTEDLMREHGVLNRLLLIYEECVRRIVAGEPFAVDALHLAARVVREFVENYHEGLEERWIFPRFQQAGQWLDLVAVLLRQHQQGRVLTDRILSLSTPQAYVQPERRIELAEACALFVRMYRPHEAREDTVVFPRFRKLVSPDEFRALGEQFEREEQRRFGADGFERVVETVAIIERRLGIYDLGRWPGGNLTE